MTAQRMVQVRGKPRTVEVHQESMSVWVAVGDYNVRVD
jgi:hypothetical protein